MNRTIDFKELKPNKLVEDLISYIVSQLGNFTTSTEFSKILFKKKNENQHSTAFCVFMTNTCNSRFCFMRENAQKGTSTIDIGVYFGANLIFTIEAKVLPTPKGNTKNPRNEHEYVYGKGAGIERFKSEKHGYDNSGTALSENAMIGYMLEEDTNFWIEKINQWIVDAKWAPSEKLKKIDSENPSKLKSVHSRTNGEVLTLHHFLVKI